MGDVVQRTLTCSAAGIDMLFGTFWLAAGIDMLFGTFWLTAGIDMLFGTFWLPCIAPGIVTLVWSVAQGVWAFGRWGVQLGLSTHGVPSAIYYSRLPLPRKPLLPTYLPTYSRTYKYVR